MKIELLSITPNAELLIEEAGRTCYESQEKANGHPEILIHALIKSGHDSVLEHASASFRISGVSRALTHQLVRHRLCSFSQKSQRYVNELQFDYIIPPSIRKLGYGAVEDYKLQMVKIQNMYEYWKNLGIKNEDARFVLPNACTSEIVTTANFREWRKVLSLRCDKHAQWEIRYMAMRILQILKENAPSAFEDLTKMYLDDPVSASWRSEISEYI